MTLVRIRQRLGVFGVGVAPSKAVLAIVLRSCALAGILAALVPFAAWSASRAAIEGSYWLSEVTVYEQQVWLGLSVQISNHSGREVHNGTLRVLRAAQAEESGPELETYAKFQHVSVPLGHSARFQRFLVVSRSEYENWVAGQPLRAEMDCTDENGVSVSFHIELVHMPEPPQS